MLGVWDLAFLGLGTIIGSGIFVTPALVLQQADGRVGVALCVWLVAGLLSLLGALAYAELGAMNPEAGGLYVYIRDAFGALPAFLYGWTLFFVIASGSIAALAVAFTAYLGRLIPLGGLPSRLAPLAMIAVLAAVNVRGTRQGARLQNATALVKAGSVLVMSALLLALGRASPFAPGTFWPERWSAATLSGAGVAMLGALWACEGWQYVSYCAGDARDPQRTFPRGIALGTAATVVIYLLANVAYVAALGPAAAARSERIGADAMTVVMGPAAGGLLASAVLVSVFGAANGVMLSSPRVFFAMARDGLFFRRLAELHPRFGTPAFAVMALSAWTLALAASGTFEQLIAYVIFVGWTFYALGGAALIVLRRRAPGAPRPFRVPGYPLTPLLFIATAAAIVLNALLSAPLRSLVGIGVVLTGVPAFLLWRRSAASGPG